MLRKRALWLFALVMLIPTMFSLAQTATPVAPTTYGSTPPPALALALAALNTRIGLTLTLASFDNTTSRYQFDYRVFTHTALDCANPGEAFEIKETPGYEIYFVYLGRGYDYRVSEADPNTLRLCRYPDRLPTAPAVLVATTDPNAVITGASTVQLDANGTPIATTGGFTADGTPNAVLTALALLNTRLGTNLTLADLSTATTLWRWDDFTFTNDALDCPRAGYTPIVGTYPGYKIKFLYLNITYEYRAPLSNVDGTFLCSVN